MQKDEYDLNFHLKSRQPLSHMKFIMLHLSANTVTRIQSFLQRPTSSYFGKDLLSRHHQKDMRHTIWSFHQKDRYASVKWVESGFRLGLSLSRSASESGKLGEMN